jgi:hypothetical protein
MQFAAVLRRQRERQAVVWQGWFFLRGEQAIQRLPGQARELDGALDALGIGRF